MPPDFHPSDKNDEAFSTDDALDTDDATRLAMRRRVPVFWPNAHRLASHPEIGAEAVAAASARLARFAPLLSAAFPELAATGGVIDSPMYSAGAIAAALGIDTTAGRIYVKADHELPVGGSVKARGGTHAVLEIVDKVALARGSAPGTVHAPHLEDLRAVRSLLAGQRISVGSTGNLGLSIGILAAELGFDVTVHMSAEAKAWKKQLLRRVGATVLEHRGDYEQALAAGRAEAADDPNTHFIDDEDSSSLLVGYATAATHVQRQLASRGVAVDAGHPLFIYLPCGVGGAPAGIALGLHHLYGPHAHCIFVEPVEAPCVLLQLLARPDERPSIRDIGLTGATEADGLTVPRASLLAARVARALVAGLCTVADDALLKYLYIAGTTQSMRLEPSAAAGFHGLVDMTGGNARGRFEALGIDPATTRASHVVWTTGGRFVPDVEHHGFLARGRALARADAQRAAFDPAFDSL